MNNISKHKISLNLARIAYTASYGAQYPLSIGLLIQTISNLQVIWIILHVGFPNSDDKNVLIFHQIREFGSYLALIGSPRGLENDMLTFIIWFICSIYIFSYFLFLLFITWLHKKEIKVNSKIEKMCTYINGIHSKLLFAPIFYFYLQFISIQKDCDKTYNAFETSCGSVWLIMTIIFMAISLIFAIISELFFYQACRSKSSCAINNNTHGAIQLAHKIILFPLLVFTDYNLLTNAIFNLAFSLLHCLFLIIILPFYNIKSLKFAIYLSTIATTFSLILFWKNIVNVKHPRIFELIIIMLAPLFLKLMRDYLNFIFKRILSLKPISPNHISILPNLFKEYIFGKEKVQVNQKSRITALYARGLMAIFQLNQIKIGEVSEVSELKGHKQRSYELILQELLKYCKRNPTSTRILLCLVQLYIEKIKNLSCAMLYIQKAQNLSLSIPELNTLGYLQSKLKRKVSEVSLESNESVEHVGYFKYEKTFKTLRQNIEKELNAHAEFWKIFSSNKVDIYQALEISKQLDSLSIAIQKDFQEHELEFKNSFPLPIIIYRIYLLTIKGIPNSSQTFFQRLYGGDYNFFYSFEKWLKEESAAIIISNQKETLGIVLEASSSVKTLFNIDKDSLIGRKVNVLMPKMIEKAHDNLIEKYNEKSGYALDLNKDVYCKTIDGNFFLAHLAGRVYHDIEKGIGLFGNFKKKEDCELLMFTDIDGYIVDCSKDVLEIFQLDSLAKNRIKLQEIAVGFEAVNNAFNIVYSRKIESTTSQPNLLFAESQKVESTQAPTQKEDLSLAMQRNFSSDLRMNSTKSDLLPRSCLTKEKQLSNMNSIPNQDYEKEFKKEENLPTVNEYKRICEQYEEGAVLYFCPKGKTASSVAQKDLQYFVKVKNLLFDNQNFKIIHLIKDEQQAKVHLVNRFIRQSTEISRADFTNNSASPIFRKQVIHNRTSEKEEKEEISSQTEEKDKVLEAMTKRKANGLFDDKLIAEDLDPSLFKASSQSSGQLRGRMIVEKIFLDLFATEKITPFTRAYFYAFYSAMLFVVILAAYGLIVTRNSFIQIKLAAELVNTDSERLLNVVTIWARGNVLFSLMSQNGDLSERLELAQSMIAQDIVIKHLSSEIVPLLKTVKSDEIIIEFYRRDIFFWGDYNGYHDGSLALDVFNAINLILDPLLVMAKCSLNSSQPDLDAVVFGLNNTINGLLLSAESELRVTQNVKANLCQDSISLMRSLIIFQSFSITFISLSLLFLIIKTHISHKKLFKVLSTISPEKIQKRENQLNIFNTWLHESPGTVKFLKQLNSFFEDHAKNNNRIDIKAIRGLQNQDKSFISRFKLKDMVLLVFAFLLFMIMLSLFIATISLSKTTVYSLQYINRISEIAENMAYQVDLLRGSFFYLISFYARPDMKIRNEPKYEQFDKILKVIKNVNAKLQSALGQPDDDFYDPDINRLLVNNICGFMACDGSPRETTFGLLGLNLQYENLISNYLQELSEDSSPDPIRKMTQSYIKELKPLNQLIRDVYRSLRAYLLENLSTNIESHNEGLVIFFISICGVCGISTALLRILVLKRLLIFERERYKVLKLIPQKLLLENKVIFSYLKREFAEELASVNSNLL